MSGSAPRGKDNLNTYVIVVVGICASALVYVSIALLQAYYAKDTAGVQMMADYGGQDKHYQTVRASQLGNISEYVNKMGTPDNPVSVHQVPIDRAVELVVAEAKAGSDHLVPLAKVYNKPTAQPIFGKPKPIEPPPAPPAPVPGASGSADAPTPGPAPAGAGSGNGN